MRNEKDKKKREEKENVYVKVMGSIDEGVKIYEIKKKKNMMRMKKEMIGEGENYEMEVKGD